MRNYSKIAAAFAALSLLVPVSCSRQAKIEGTLTDGASSEVVVKLLDVNKYQVLDTLKTDASGRYSYKANVAPGQPEFIYIFYKDTRIASLLLQAGDKVTVSSDTLGTYSVSGSDETLKLMDVEKDEADFSNSLLASAYRLRDLPENSEAAAELRRKMTQDYIAYYRGRVKYILSNSHSLTVIPVLYQVVGDDLPVFGQLTDAIHFSNMADSLMTVYPESRYVKALAKEAARRQQYLNLSTRINNAEEAGYPDIELGNIKGEKVKLSSVVASSKVVMLYFWTSTDAAQTLFNTDVMLPVYEEFKDKGFEIYSVGADVDKSAWAAVVRNQNLPWVNVCDAAGSASVALATYNVQSLPVSYFIIDSKLTPAPGVKDEATLRRFIKDRL